MYKYIIAIISLLFFLTGCGGVTTLSVNSIPDNAETTMKNYGKKFHTNATFEIDKRYFGKAKKKAERFCFKKENYRSTCKEQILYKSKQNLVRVQLDKIDSAVVFHSIPEGATVELNTDDLPIGWQRKFKTPIVFRATADEIRDLKEKGLAIKSVKYEGYYLQNLSKYNEELLEPGIETSVTMKMTPIITTVRIMTEPEGATVEDITQGGFGYLGETPVVRNITWKDIANWADRKKVQRSDKSFDSIELNLRISKPGYKDVIMQSLRIPIGEERTFKRSLKQLVKEVSFSSDPDGVHVYVKRDVVEQLYDPKQGKVVTITVPFYKHLGTTPFTYNIDPSNPLKHGDTLLFRKSGYKDATMLYADGEDGFHMVLEPEVVKAR